MYIEFVQDVFVCPEGQEERVCRQTVRQMVPLFTQPANTTTAAPGDDHVFAEYIWMSAVVVVVVVVLAPRSQEVSPQDLQGYREGLQGYQ